MRIRPLFVFIGASGLVRCLFPLMSAATPSPVLSAEELFRAGTLAQAEISADGRHLGVVSSDEHDWRHLVIVDTKDYTSTGLRATKDFEIASFRWLGNDRILYHIVVDKLYSWGLYTAPLKRLDDRHPIDSYSVTQIIGLPRRRPGQVIAWVRQSAQLEGRPGGLVEYDALRRPDSDRPRLNNEAMVQSYPPPKGGVVVGWTANHAGELALCHLWQAGDVHTYRYLPESVEWREVILGPRTSIVTMDPDDRYAWVVTRTDEAGYELRRCELATGTLGPAVLADADYDPGTGRLFFAESTGELAGICYVQRKPVSVWFNATYGAIQAAVDKRFVDSDAILVDRDERERKFLFHLTGPTQPGRYVLLDLDAKSFNHIAVAAPWLDGRPLQPVHPMSFHTRDGVRLEGYLTLPPGASAEHPAPLVVLVHGGPHVRDDAEFNPEVQFLASRGYAVLQPNYRGSAGYAPAISYTRRYDFRRMHDDVTDATRAMLQNPSIDSKRVAIMGASFGGFLALSGVTFETGLYRCAVSECGVFDWEQFIRARRYDGRPGEYEMLVDDLGKPGRDRDRLQELSPLAHADRIHVPVLIAHGTEDNIVDVAQSKQLAAALKRLGVPHETFFRKLEGHGFRNYKTRVEFYHRVETFLAAQLGGATLASGK